MNYCPPLRRAKAGNRLREPRVQVTAGAPVPGRVSAVAQPVRDTALVESVCPRARWEEWPWASSPSSSRPWLRGPLCRVPTVPPRTFPLLALVFSGVGGAVSPVGEPQGLTWSRNPAGRCIPTDRLRGRPSPRERPGGSPVGGTAGGSAAPGRSLRWLLAESGLPHFSGAGLALTHPAVWLVPAGGGGLVLGGAPTGAAEMQGQCLGRQGSSHVGPAVGMVQEASGRTAFAPSAREPGLSNLLSCPQVRSRWRPCPLSPRRPPFRASPPLSPRRPSLLPPLCQPSPQTSRRSLSPRLPPPRLRRHPSSPWSLPRLPSSR